MIEANITVAQERCDEINDANGRIRTLFDRYQKASAFLTLIPTQKQNALGELKTRMTTLSAAVDSLAEVVDAVEPIVE